MIDTLNLSIRNVKYLDITNLLRNDIRVYYYANIGNSYKKYKLTSQNRQLIKNFPEYGIMFNYYSISFKYRENQKLLTMITKPSEILNKDIICVKDIEQYKQHIADILNVIIPNTKIKVKVNAIHYKTDIKFTDRELLEEYVKLLDKHDAKFRYTTKRETQKTDNCKSLYLSNKNRTNKIKFL